MNEQLPASEPSDKNILNAPPRMILFTLTGIIFLSMFAGSTITALACDMQGVDLRSIFADFGKKSSSDIRNFVRGTLLLNHTMTFLVPAVIAGWLFYRKNWPAAIALHRKPTPGTLGQALLFTAGAFPLAQLLFTFNRWVVNQFPALEKFTAAEAGSENMVLGLLSMQSFDELLFNLLVMALIPALGEEMIFRGFLQRQLGRLFRKPAPAILLSAFIFSLTHFQIQRFLAIFLLGAVLGLLFYYTKNLWVPILAHFLNNGIQVVVAWFYQDKLNELNQGGAEEIPWAVYLVSALAFLSGGYLLHKNKQQENA